MEDKEELAIQEVVLVTGQAQEDTATQAMVRTCRTARRQLCR